MGTRAVYTFIDDTEKTHHVFKHWDNYPSGAMEFLNNSLPYAWSLPRFEACEFSASFIASNKQKGGGDLRLAKHWDKFGDLDYRYEITLKDKNLYIKIFERDFKNTEDYSDKKYLLLDEGFLFDLMQKYKGDENVRAIN